MIMNISIIIRFVVQLRSCQAYVHFNKVLEQIHPPAVAGAELGFSTSSSVIVYSEEGGITSRSHGRRFSVRYLDIYEQQINDYHHRVSRPRLCPGLDDRANEPLERNTVGLVNPKGHSHNGEKNDPGADSQHHIRIWN